MESNPKKFKDLKKTILNLTKELISKKGTKDHTQVLN
jgi:hypothetical protein